MRGQFRPCFHCVQPASYYINVERIKRIANPGRSGTQNAESGQFPLIPSSRLSNIQPHYRLSSFVIISICSLLNGTWINIVRSGICRYPTFYMTNSFTQRNHYSLNKYWCIKIKKISTVFRMRTCSCVFMNCSIGMFSLAVFALKLTLFFRFQRLYAFGKCVSLYACLTFGPAVCYSVIEYLNCINFFFIFY